jgi:hypothetical protein
LCFPHMNFANISGIFLLTMNGRPSIDNTTGSSCE